MTGPEESLGLYLHLPFCEVKCSYCHFAIDPTGVDPSRHDRYLRALGSEIEARAADLASPEVRPPADSVYLGGGTPSLVGPARVEALLRLLERCFARSPDAEVTIEANPKDLDRRACEALLAAGVNRLSLGVQALDDTVLAEMGRLHGARDALSSVAAAREAGFRNLSLDLILGWPGETWDRWQRTLGELARLGPDHVSVYLLEVSGKSLLADRQRRGTLELPDDDLVADLYRAAVEALGALGLARYEISNFARPGRESRHNARYWDDRPFLGFGMSAHGYLDGCRIWNLPSYGGYCRAVETRGGLGARAGERILTPRERRAEALFTGLRRRQGVELAGFAARYGASPLDEFAQALRDPFDAGLLEVAEGCLQLTEAGILLSNEVFQRLV